MTDPKLTYYIKRSLDNGIKKEEINAILIDAGWKQNLIDEGFREVGGEKQANPAGVSKFDKLRKWLLILIGARLALIPVQFFLFPLVISMVRGEDYSQYFGYDLALTVALPLFWALPFFFIWRHKKAGHILAIIFSLVLIYLNLFGFVYLFMGNGLGVLSAIYFITGLLIIFLSSLSLKYFPGRSEEPNTLMPINESSVTKTRWVITSIVTLVVLATGLFVGINGGIGFGDDAGVGSFIIATIFGICLGLYTAQKLIDCVKYNRQWMSTGIFAGFIGGIVAQIPVWGNSGILIIAMPVGAVVGVLVATLGGGWILYAATESLLGKK